MDDLVCRTVPVTVIVAFMVFVRGGVCDDDTEILELLDCA